MSTPKNPKNKQKDEVDTPESVMANVSGNGGFVFADVRPSADIILNTAVAKTSQEQVIQPLPVPRPTGELALDLADVISADAIKTITNNQKMVFHTVGDTGGVQIPNPQLAVADSMVVDLDLPNGNAPSFFMHLGDVVYFDGQAECYYQQFYYPYRHYNAPIFAIPGNHDGDMPDGKKSADSLKAFVENFCTKKPAKTPESKDTLRTAMTQPYVYFRLDTPLATFVNLYTNCPSLGYVDSQQKQWFVKTLQNAPANKALILALHHPVFSEDGDHGSNNTLLQLIDSAAGNGRHPDLVLTGHVHNYQRFTRTLSNGKEYPYIVAGGGGYYDLYPVGEYSIKSNVPTYVKPGLKRTNPDRTLVKYVDNYYGYLRITVTPTKILGSFLPCYRGDGTTKYHPADNKSLSLNKSADDFTVDLENHTVT
jgi:acid phosphatase type 7